MHSISKRGLDFIKGFESFVPYVYDDLRAPVHGKYREWDGSTPVGTLTIGYGHTNAAKHPLKIAKGLRVTEDEGTEILRVDLSQCEREVNALVKPKISQGQYDALVSFDFNCGVGNLKKLIGPLNSGEPEATRRNFDLYTRSKGKVLAGLQRRRDGEQAMWDRGYSDAPDPAVSLDIPKAMDAPPLAKPMTHSKTLWSVGGQILGGLGTVGAAFAGLDWKVFAVAGGLVVVLALVIGRERIRKLFDQGV